MNTLFAGNLTLEPQMEAHAEEMFGVLCDPAIYEFERVPPPSIEKLAAGYRRRESRQSDDGSEQWLNWVVRLSTGELTGYVQATVLPDGHAYIGYEFASRFWRQGLASASITAASVELAARYHVHTLVAVVKLATHPSNQPQTYNPPRATQHRLQTGHVPEITGHVRRNTHQLACVDVRSGVKEL